GMDLYPERRQTLPPGPIWECAAGDGVLGDDLAAAGREVILSDIDPKRRGIIRLDFLHDEPPAKTEGSIAATNPPFGKSELLDPSRAGITALLDSGWLSATVLLLRADAAATIGRCDILNRAVAEGPAVGDRGGSRARPASRAGGFTGLSGCRDARDRQ